MIHVANDDEMALTSKLDFVVPLKQVGLITRAVLEAIHLYYAPRRIIIVSSRAEGEIVRSLCSFWNAGVVEFVDEESFFERHYNVTIQQIQSEYDPNRTGDQREPGWWIQQLIKLGAATQIPDLTTNYVVWDGDLIPTRRWKLAERDRNGAVKYYIAILQAEARSEFNSYQYAMCMKALTGDTPRDPQGGGTFVAHHMVFNRHYVAEMLEHMRQFTGSDLPWPLLIMSYSRKFYRFSEYKTYATYMLNRHPTEFHYHPLAAYGEGGVRFRDANRIVENMLSACPLSRGGLSYAQVTEYARTHMAEFRCRDTTGVSALDATGPPIPGYIQLDHVYGIAKLGLDPAGLPVLAGTSLQRRSVTQPGSNAICVDLAGLISAATAVIRPVIAEADGEPLVPTVAARPVLSLCDPGARTPSADGTFGSTTMDVDSVDSLDSTPTSLGAAGDCVGSAGGSMTDLTVLLPSAEYKGSHARSMKGPVKSAAQRTSLTALAVPSGDAAGTDAVSVSPTAREKVPVTNGRGHPRALTM